MTKRTGLAALMLAMSLGCAPRVLLRPDTTPGPNHALALTRDGYVDTGVYLSELNNSAHTVAFRFQAHQPHSGYGWFVGESRGGRYLIGQGKGGRLHLNVGWQRVDTDYVLQANTWTHVALSVSRGSLTLYVNGREVFSGLTSMPLDARGRLRLGRRSDAYRKELASGLVDDVWVLNAALSAREVAALADGGEPEGDLVLAHYDFEHHDPKLKFVGNAQLVDPVAEDPWATSRPIVREDCEPDYVRIMPSPDAPVLGPTDAPVTVVVLESLTDPDMLADQPALLQLLELYPRDVRIAFLFLDDWEGDKGLGCYAAEAALAANVQGRFPQVYRSLISHSPGLTPDVVRQSLLDAGLDPDELKGLTSGRWHEEVAANEELRRLLRPSSTPVFNINGLRIHRLVSLTTLRRAVDQSLERARAVMATGVPRAQVYDKVMQQYAPPVLQDLSVSFTPGRRARATLPPDAPSIGPKDATVTVVEFLDYGAGECRHQESVDRDVLRRSGGDVRIVYRFPVDSLGSRAALAASAQGRFAVFHRRLWGHGAAFAERYAVELGLDLARFRADLHSPATDARLAADRAEWQRVNPTAQLPTVVANSLVLQNPHALKQGLEKAREAANAKLKAGVAPEKVYEALLADAPESPWATRTFPAWAPTRGPADAPVTIEVWSAYECGPCRQIPAFFDELEQEYPDKLRFVSRHSSLHKQPGGLTPLHAAMAAHTLGRFRQMDRALYETPEAKTEGEFIRVAEQVGLDAGAFKEALRSAEVRQMVQAELAAAEDRNLGGVPTFFVNGFEIAALRKGAVRAAIATALEVSASR